MTHRRQFMRSLTGIVALNALAGTSFAATVRKIALVVGNAGYEGPERLKNPAADASLTASTLRKLGFQTNLATDRNAAQLKADLEAFGQAARGADIALFFYAGHGIAVENINYLLAVDQNLATATSREMKRQGISVRWIESLLQRDTGVSVIVVDACRNTLMRGMPQLVLDLQLHILRNPIAPQPDPLNARRFAFQQLDIRSTHHLAVDVGQYPGVVRVLQHRIDAAHPVTGAARVVRSHYGLQKGSPVHGTQIVRTPVAWWSGRGAPCLLHPKLQLRLIRVEPDSRSRIGTANASLADLQPLIAAKILGLDQLEGRAGFGGRRHPRWNNGMNHGDSLKM